MIVKENAHNVKKMVIVLQTSNVIYKPINASVKIFGREIIVLFPNAVEPYNVLVMEHVRKLLMVLTNVLARLLRINLLIVLDRKGMETYALGKTGKENQMELLSFLHKQMQNHPTYVKGM